MEATTRVQRSTSLNASRQDDGIGLHLGHLLLELLLVLLQLLTGLLGGGGRAGAGHDGQDGGGAGLVRRLGLLLLLSCLRGGALCGGARGTRTGARCGGHRLLHTLERRRRCDRGLGDANLGLLAVAAVAVRVLLDGGRDQLGVVHLEGGNQGQGAAIMGLHGDMVDDEVRWYTVLAARHLLGGL